MRVKPYVVRQFGNPKGMVGWLAGHIMARRSSNRIRNHKTVDMMALQPDSRVLEIGCGPGLALTQCAALVRDGNVVGLDHSPVMIDQARNRLQNAGLSQKAVLHVGGVERLADWPMRFDRVYSLNVIQFIPDKAKYYHSVYDALIVGGKCFTTYQPRMDNNDPDGATLMAEKITALMQAADFRRLTARRLKQDLRRRFACPASKSLIDRPV
jgi:cyclopropane fatty-acyl-phospholipid synthase-like methyltransferase